jgi:CO dehydrogenase/acetyl-CoA synthase alpha subunit
VNQQLMATWKVELVINPTRSNQVARINVEHTNLFMPTYEQTMPHALQQYVIADGKITLYQRDDVKDGIWQCRMTI